MSCDLWLPRRGLEPRPSRFWDIASTARPWPSPICTICLQLKSIVSFLWIRIEKPGASFQLFLGGQNFFLFFNVTGLLKNWKKQHFICSNLTLFIVPFFLFSLFFLFFVSFFFFSFFLGATPPSPPKWRLCEKHILGKYEFNDPIIVTHLFSIILLRHNWRVLLIFQYATAYMNDRHRPFQLNITQLSFATPTIKVSLQVRSVSMTDQTRIQVRLVTHI